MSQAKKMAKHSSIYAIGNISRQLVGFLMLPVYTRYLSPADYGVIGLLMFSISLIELFFGARMGQALPKFYYQEKAPEQKQLVISSALLLTVGISIIPTALLIIASDTTSALLFDNQQFSLIVGLFAILILTHALESYSLVYIRIQQRPWLFISINLAKLTMQLSMNIYLVVYQEMGILGVAISNVSSSIVFAVILGTFTLYKTGLGFQSKTAISMLSFCWPLWIAGIAALYIGSSNRYFIKYFGDLEGVGLYELAAKFGTILTLLIWQPFAQYWQTERFDLYNHENPIPIYQATFKFISLLLLLAASGISLLAGPVIQIMADSAFHRAYLAVPFLAFGAVFSALVNFSNFSFLVKDQTKWISKNNYLTAAIVTIFYIFLIPQFGFVGAAIGLMLAQITQFLIVYFSAKKLYDMQLSLTFLISIATSAGAIVAVAITLQGDSVYTNILIGLAGIISIFFISGWIVLRDKAVKVQTVKFIKKFKS